MEKVSSLLSKFYIIDITYLVEIVLREIGLTDPEFQQLAFPLSQSPCCPLLLESTTALVPNLRLFVQDMSETLFR